MDAYEATKIVFLRIQGLDPENASKIMGLLLLKDHGEMEMIRLAFGPEALLHSVILKARKELRLPSNSPTTPLTPSSPSPFFSNNPLAISRQSSSSSSGSSRLLVIPNPTSGCSSGVTSSTISDLISPSTYTQTMNGFSNDSSSSSNNSLSSPFYGGGGADLIDEFQLQDQLSFLNEGPKNPDLYYPDMVSSPNGNGGDAMLFSPYGANWGGVPHRRSCSVNDICLGSDDPASGFGWKPCLYFARGYCKNGTSCKFLHGGSVDSPAMLGSDPTVAPIVGSPSKLDMMEQCHELLRPKSAHQQQQQQHRLASASPLMASSSFPYSSKCMNFLLQQQQSDTQRAAAMIMGGDDMHKFGRSRLERGEFSMNGGLGMVNPGSRQIYLTFPADSTFREEDVSNYFSIYGPVQDVRIPYQQKRMFGFVTFVYPETVKLILAKGNPHFVCDARVLVKPYKEKGKVPDKKQQQGERGEFAACSSPTGLDGRDPFDLQIGARMFYNTQELLWRRKLEEQADLQQAIELQGRRLMGLQLLDVKKHHHHRNLSNGTPIPSPTHSPNMFNQPFVLSSDRSSPESPDVTSLENGSINPPLKEFMVEKELKENCENGTGIENGNGKESPLRSSDESDLPESLEHNLPDSPFASPTKAAGDYMSAFSNGAIEAEKTVNANNNLITSSILPATSTLDMASFKSCYFQMPRFSSGHGAIGM